MKHHFDIKQGLPFLLEITVAMEDGTSLLGGQAYCNATNKSETYKVNLSNYISITSENSFRIEMSALETSELKAGVLKYDVLFVRPDDHRYILMEGTLSVSKVITEVI